MRLAPLLFIILISNISFAADLGETDLVRMAYSSEWLRLNYYVKSTFGKYKSQVLTPDFFISKMGQVSPIDELKHTIDKQLNSDNSSEWICKYPARYQFIAQEKNINPLSALSQCKELSSWKKSLNVRSLSLVYPAQSLESSLSLFSHTFLKINDASKDMESSLHTVISFAANFAPGESMVSLALNGLFGGYAGKFGTSHFYDELIRYGYQETRDIFEYEMSFSEYEIDRMLNHLWEMQKISVRYYFLDENCSYYLLKLMEIGRPSLNLSRQFPRLTIPAESVREIVMTENLVVSTNYYPSKENKRLQRLSSMSKEELSVYSSLSRDPSVYSLVSAALLLQLKEPSQARVLDAFNDYLTYLGTDEAVAIRAIVLVDRSRIVLRDKEKFSQTRLPPESGHKPHRIGFGYGSNHDAEYLEFNWRMVLHDRKDPGPSYVQNTDLEFLNLNLSWQENRLNIESLKILKVLTLHPITAETKNASSKFISEVARPKTSRLVDRKYFTNEVGSGFSFAWPRASVYVMGNLAMNYHHDLEKSYQAGLGVEASLFIDVSSSWKLMFLSRYQDFSMGEKNHFLLNEAAVAWSRGIEQSWQLLMGRSDENTYGKIQTLFYF